MDYITQPKDYWIAQQAIVITLNALGNPNRIQGSVASGAVISCYIENVDGLGLDNGRNPKRWPLSLSPTYFNTNTEKYVYVAIPRSTSVGTQAVVVFPSEKLDIYGKNAQDEQIGSTDYYYVWLQGILSSSGEYSNVNRVWTSELDFGKLGTYEDIIDMSESDWYSYSRVSQIVTFLKPIFMKAGSYFQNLILGNKELTGVATGATSEEYVDSETLVVTPSYINGKYLRKDVEDTAQEQIGFLKGIWIGIKDLYEITADGVAKFKSLFVDDITAQRMQVEDMQSSNYTGDGIADTGWRLTKDYNGHSKLTIDELYVRIKAVFESLEIKKEMVTGGNQIFSHAANVICRTDYYNSSNQKIGYSEVKVPWLLRGLQMVLSKRILSGIYSKVRSVRISIDDPTEIAYIRCYFLAEEGGREVNNLWSVTDGNDLARCQTFNLNRSERKTYVDGEDVKQGNVFWWRKVIAVSSNSNPVEIEGKKYHYFDVSNQSGGYMAGSDLPCAGDEVSQWGNDANEARMNLVTIEVDGAVAIKAYEGIYTFDMSKCWYGGNPCKMNLSPQNEYRFTGRKFKIETEYGVRPVPVDIDVDWAAQTKSRAEYAETGIAVGDLIVKNYYYDRVPHNGSLWLCLFTGNAYWARYAKYDGGVITYVNEEDFFNDEVVPPSQRLYQRIASRAGIADEYVCRRQEYTSAQPGTNSAVWKQEVAKGQNGIDAQDVEWAYIRTKTNVAPEIDDEEDPITIPSEDSNGHTYVDDEYLPFVVVSSGEVESNGMEQRPAGGALSGDEYGECTDNPKGVDDTWKYEWEIKRTKGTAIDGHRAWQPYSGTMTLHANFAESAFIIDTDNDNDQFATDSNSEVLVTQVRQTVVALYDGATLQTLTALTATLTYEDGTSVPSGVATVTAMAATGVVEVTVLHNSTANTHSEIRANITATCAKGSKQTVFTLRKVMGGAPGLNPIIYQLAPTQKTLSFSRTSANALIPSSQSSQINVARTEGNTTTILSSAQTGISYQWGFDTNSIAEETGKAVGSSISISNTQAVSHYQVWIELSTGDRETLPIVKDGQNGAIGDTPVQAYQWNSSPTTAPSPLPSGATLGNWSFVAPARPSTAGEHFLWMTQSVKHTALDGTVTYDTWGAATRVSGNNGTNGKDAQYIYLKGTARDVNNTITTTIPCVVNVNGGTNAATVNRGLNLVTINRQTLAVVESVNYDTYGQIAETGTGITNLITKLDALDNTVFVCLVSYDAVGWNSSLITALQNFGMGDLPYTQTGRYPFLFIGYKGLGKGNGLMRMHDVGAYTDVVELAAYVANGALSAGADGEDAVSIDITPASLIVNQDLQNPDNLSSLTQTFVVKVYKGDVEQTVNGISFVAESVPNSSPVAYKCLFLNGGGQRSGNSNIQGNVLTLKQINTYTQDGKTLYYDSMYADVTATYNTNKTITARIRIYANLLGTWKETIEGDVQEQIAESTTYEVDGEQFTVKDNLGNFVKSSTQNISRISETIKAGEGNRNLFGFAACSFGVATNDCGYPCVQSYGMLLKFAGSSDSDGRLARVTIPSLEIGKTYTLSCQIMMTYQDAHIQIDLGGSSVSKIIEATTSWHTIEVALPFNNTANPDFKWIDFGITDFDSEHPNNYALLRHVKLELGETATPFRIANEDINSVTNIRPVDEWTLTDMTEDSTVSCPSGKKVYKTNNMPPSVAPNNYIDYIKCSNLNGIQVGKVYTLSFWVKKAATQNDEQIILFSYLYPDMSGGVSQEFIELPPSADGQSEAIKADCKTLIAVTAEWVKHYVYFYPISVGSTVNCIPLRLENVFIGGQASNYRGTLYISDVQLCEGYVSEDNNTVNESYSEIKQTAKEINLGLSGVGINIYGPDKSVTVKAQQFRVTDSSGQNNLIVADENDDITMTNTTIIGNLYITNTETEQGVQYEYNLSLSSVSNKPLVRYLAERSENGEKTDYSYMGFQTKDVDGYIQGTIAKSTGIIGQSGYYHNGSTMPQSYITIFPDGISGESSSYQFYVNKDKGIGYEINHGNSIEKVSFEKIGGNIGLNLGLRLNLDENTLSGGDGIYFHRGSKTVGNKEARWYGGLVGKKFFSVNINGTNVYFLMYNGIFVGVTTSAPGIGWVEINGFLDNTVWSSDITIDDDGIVRQAQ